MKAFLYYLFLFFFLGKGHCQQIDSRELPQTPWHVDGVRKLDTSLEEILLVGVRTLQGNVVNVLKTQEKSHLGWPDCTANFSSSGREDVDVRMLGNGRPFVFEITNPRKTKFSRSDFESAMKSVSNHSNIVKMSDFQLVAK